MMNGKHLNKLNEGDTKICLVTVRWVFSTPLSRKKFNVSSCSLQWVFFLEELNHLRKYEKRNVHLAEHF